MDKTTLIGEFTSRNKEFIDFIKALPDNEFSKQYDNKWSAGQNLKHIFLSVRPLNQALYLPKFLFLIFGGSGKSSSYDALVERYQSKLKNGAKATRSYIPKKVSLSQKTRLIQKLNKTIESLGEKVNQLKESDLDKYRLPHPIIGFITIREMLYFGIYHPQHHQKNVENNLLSKK